MYGTYLTLASLLLLAYVLWRASAAPLPRRLLPLAGPLLALLLVVGRWLGHDASGPWAARLEFLSMSLVGTLFLVFVCLLPADLLSGAWILFRRRDPLARRRAASIRGGAIAAGLLLSLLAHFQGLRPPRIVRFPVRLPGLPAALDGTRIAALSDLHLGALVGPGWLEARVRQVQSLKPDMILVLGDVFEGHGARVDDYLPAMRRLAAPLGIWAVEGNHEGHGRRNGAPLDPAVSWPWRTLRDETAQPAPGLFLAGRRHRSRHGTAPETPCWNPAAADDRGATILMSHAPEAAGTAARAGVGLMLAGHTHGGQIWPLSVATALANPLLSGRYEIGGMTVLVSRGAGTWGPRMRLWKPGEILLVTLRAAPRRPAPR